MLGISADSIINSVNTGQMKDIQKCQGAFRVDNGCPCAGVVNGGFLLQYA